VAQQRNQNRGIGGSIKIGKQQAIAAAMASA